MRQQTYEKRSTVDNDLFSIIIHRALFLSLQKILTSCDATRVLTYAAQGVALG
jgi:hypothetical protein